MSEQTDIFHLNEHITYLQSKIKRLESKLAKMPSDEEIEKEFDDDTQRGYDIIYGAKWIKQTLKK